MLFNNVTVLRMEMLLCKVIGDKGKPLECKRYDIRHARTMLSIYILYTQVYVYIIVCIYVQMCVYNIYVCVCMYKLVHHYNCCHYSGVFSLV